MIIEQLNNKKLLLKVNPNMPTGIANRWLHESGTDLIVDNPPLNVDNPQLVNAYFLPWKFDTGYYIDLPQTCKEDTCFFTAELTGCCVGVQLLDSGDIRVCHYNIRGEFDIEDFKRYNDDTKQRSWLLPDKYKGKVDGIKCEFYGGYNNGANPTVFWGEYKVEQKWKFYYQRPSEILDFQLS